MDISGELESDDDFGLSDNKDWQEYWRELFPTITVDDINKFQEEFKGLSHLVTTSVYVYDLGSAQSPDPWGETIGRIDT